MRDNRRRPVRVVSTVVTTTAATVAAVALSSTGSASAGTPATSAKATTTSQHVIVLLKNQFSGLQARPGSADTRARSRAIASDQAPVIDVARSAGARNVTAYSVINGFAATVTPSAAAALSHNPSVAAVVPDLAVRTAPAPKHDLTSAAVRSAAAAPDSSSYCSNDENNPILEPEALQTMKVDYNDTSKPSASDYVDGTGVTVGYIADGVDINNPDFQRDGSSVFTDYKDFSGEGINAPSPAAESFGDASAIAAQGNQVYDVNSYSPSVNQPDGCYIRIRGVAPGADLVGLKVFGNSNTAPTSHFISAIQYAVNTDHVDVLNESFGGDPYPDTNDDPITLADEAAIAAGTTVVASTGDAGVTGTTGSPATAPGVIAAAATTIYRSVEQLKLDGLTNPALGVTGWADDNISSLSSGGFAQNGKLPDVSAPGELGWALCSPDTSTYEECTNEVGQPSDIQDFGGTSQASPLTSGAAALVIQAYEQAHGGAKPTPSLVKSILMGTAQDLNHPADEQGAGEVNALAAVQAAMSVPAANSSTTPDSATGDSLITRTSKSNVDQLDLTGPTNSTVSGSFTVQNASPSTQTVSLKSRSLTKTLSTQSGSLTLDPNQTFPNITGSPRAYKIVNVNVPVGADRLNGRIAFDSSDNGGYTVFMAVVDPFGTFQDYSEPQGLGNYGWVDVRNPAPGTWKAMIWANPSFTAPIHYQFTTSKYANYGSVSPSSVTLAPGASAKISTKYPLSTNAGDSAASVVMTTPLGASSTVPVSLRTLVPTSKADNRFTGVLTGGNGRSGSPGEEQTYSLDVPKNKANLLMRISLADRTYPNELLYGFFIDPNGHVQSARSNVIVTGQGLDVGRTIVNTVAHPMPGRWRYLLVLPNPVGGSSVDQPFYGDVRYPSVAQATASLPSHKTTLTKGKTYKYTVTLHNTEAEQAVYVADPRRARMATYNLASQVPGNDLQNLSLPEPGVTPQWLVPTDSSSISFYAHATTPIGLDTEWEFGDPEVYGAPNGDSASVTQTYANIANGYYSGDIGEPGPFTDSAPSGTASANATATTHAFDLNADSSLGDYWFTSLTPPPAPQTADAGSTTAGAKSTAAFGQSGRVLDELRTQSRQTPVRAAKAQAEPKASTPQCDPSLPALERGQSCTITFEITPNSNAKSGSVVHGHLNIQTLDIYTGTTSQLVALPYGYTVK